METNDIQIEENSIITTKEINKYFADNYTDLSELYDSNFETLGKVELLSIALKLVDRSNKKTIDYLYDKEIKKTNKYEIIIDSKSNIIYPIIVTDNEKANILDDFNVIVNKIINKKSIFTMIGEDETRYIKPGVKIGKSSNNFVFLSKPEAIFESNIEDALKGTYPYFIRLMGKELKEANAIIEITNLLENSSINLIEYCPYPIKGLMEIENIMVNNQYIQNKQGIIPYLEDSSFERTEKNFIPFLPINGNKINFSVGNKSRINSLNSVIIGIELIEAFQVTYASTSYFGYKLVIPENKKLKGLDFIGKWYNSSISGITAKIYESKTDFDEMNSNYILNIDSTISGSLNLIANKEYYILFTMNLDEQLPQTIEKVGIRFDS